MTKVKINPGICGLITNVQTQSDDGMEVEIIVKSDCEAISKMFSEIGTTFDAFDLCLSKPGQNILYESASKFLPGHASCPVISGIIKAAEVECKLALPKDVTITFE